MKIIGAVFGVIVLVVVLIGIGVLGNLVGLWQYQFFGPRLEAVRRDIMINSRAYTEGETRNLYKYKIEFDKAAVGSPERETIRLAAQHECEAFDTRRLPAELAAFCNPLD